MILVLNHLGKRLADRFGAFCNQRICWWNFCYGVMCQGEFYRCVWIQVRCWVLFSPGSEVCDGKVNKVFLSMWHSHTQHTTEMLVLTRSFCHGSTLWRNCLCGVQLAGKTAPLHPCLPRKKLVSKTRSPGTDPKGKRWSMGSSERGLAHCSHLSAPRHPGWDVSAGASWRRAALQGGSLSFCWPASTDGSEVPTEVRIKSRGQTSQQ